MKPNRRLVLRREALGRLDTDELRGLVGGTHVPTDCGCVTHGYSCEVCPVPSLPLNTCLCYTIDLITCPIASITCTVGTD